MLESKGPIKPLLMVATVLAVFWQWALQSITARRRLRRIFKKKKKTKWTH